MTLLIGGHSPVQGWTDRAKAASAVFGDQMVVWLASAQASDAQPYKTCVHFLRLDNWMTGEAPAAYVQRQTARIQPWHTTIPNLVLIPGNESDREAGHGGESIQQYADALRAAFPGVKVSNVPLTVANTANATYTGCDVAVAHSYFERQHPETMGDPQFGRSYRHAQASGLPTYCTEFNVVQTNCPIDWSNRNLQAAAWLDQAEGDGVAGAAFFILDAAPDWASYDVGPEAAADILAHRKGVVPPPVTKSPFAFEPISSTATLRAMVTDGSMAGMNSPFLDGAVLDDLIAACADQDVSIRVLMAWLKSENRMATDISAGLLAAHNGAGIKYVGQRKATSGADAIPPVLAPANEGYAPYCIFANWSDFFWTLARNIATIMPDAWATGDLASIARYYTGGDQGLVKVADYTAYNDRVKYPADPTPPVPPPAPPPVTTGVTGDDIIDKARQYIGQQVSDGTLDSWNPPHPWGGYCEAFTEGVPFVLGLTVVHRGSALQKLQAVTDQGMLETSWPPEHGGCCLYGADFDPAGHATLWDADQGAFLGTLENPSNIGYHPATGAWRTQEAGWYRIPGVTAARRSPPIIVPPPNLVIPGNPYQVTDPAHQIGVGGAIRTFWDALGDRQFQVLGFPELNEQQAWVTELDGTKRQRTVQRFERSYVIHQPEAPDGWRVVLALLSQKIAIVN